MVQSRIGSSGGVLSTPGDKERIGKGAGAGRVAFALREQTGGLQAWEVTRTGGYEVGGGVKGGCETRERRRPTGGQRDRGPAPAAIGSNLQAAGPRRRERPLERMGPGGPRGKFSRPKRKARRAQKSSRTW